MVSKKEGINLPDEFAKRIAEKSERNLRRALLMLESCKVQQQVSARSVLNLKFILLVTFLNSRYPFTPKQDIVEPDWEIFLRETGQKMVSEQSPKALLEVRSRIYELLSHCIAPEIIIKVILIRHILVVACTIKCFSRFSRSYLGKF